MSADKRNVSPAQWTQFWQSLGIAAPKRQRFLRHYKPGTQDVGPLRRIGVERSPVDKVQRLLSGYRDPMLFHMFGQFFRADPYTVQRWCNVGNPTDAFTRLFNVFSRRSLPELRKRFGELRLLSELSRKGEGWRYQIRYRAGRQLKNISGTRFTRLLNYYDPKSKYLFENSFRYDSSWIIAIKKRSRGRDVFKFITLKKTGNTVEAKIAADSKKEHALIRKVLGDYFESYVDSPQSAASLARFQNFLRSGASAHFQLVGISYFQDDYRISIAPKFNQRINVAEQRGVRQYLRSNDPERVVVQIRIAHTGEVGRIPVFVDVRTSSNSDLIGAIIFDLRDRALRPYERQLLVADFERDFGFELGAFVSYDDLPDGEIYKRLLQSVGRRSSDMELRSDRALNIYKQLVAEGLIDERLATQDEPAFCVRGNCSIAYSQQRNRQYCKACGERLIAGKAVVQPKVNEGKAAAYLEKELSAAGFFVERFSKVLLRRPYHVTSVTVGATSVEIVPLVSALNDSQQDLLRLRMPNALVLTARDNVGDFAGHNIECRPLHEFVSLLEQGQTAGIRQTIQDVAQHGTGRMYTYARDAALRYGSDAFYQQKNGESKNLGAEFFEADTFLLFAYMFRNSIWLGAKQRGVPVPDGISAFPVLASGTRGCLLWDSKYSDGRVKLGPIKKNQTYITAARKNDSIKGNGGLGGFAFVSNQPAPGNFDKRYRKLGGPRKPKIVYMTSAQLMRIFRHFREHENEILNNARCQSQFATSMDSLLMRTAGGHKTLIVSDDELNTQLDSNAEEYERLRAPSLNM